MSNWKTYKLGDLVTFQRGHDLSKSEFIEGHYPIAGSNGVIGFHNKYTTKGPSITIGRSGSIGTPYYYEKDFWAHNTTLYVKEFHNTHPKFIYYLLKTLDFSGHNSGSAVPSLNRNFIHPIEVNAPDFQTQKSIAEILSSLDDKISLNRHINQTLDEMAKLLFTEICLPKEEGLPNDWEETKVGNLIESVSETYKFGNKEEVIFLNTSDIFDGLILNTQYSDVLGLPGQAKKRISKNDILYSEIRPINRRFAFIDFDGGDYVVSTKLMVLRAKAIDPIFMYFYLTKDDVLEDLQNIAESRSGTFPQITFTQLGDVPILLPPKEILDGFIDQLKDLYHLVTANQKETQTLIEMRDRLLPKLISGDLIPSELKEAEAIL